jgi:hypothetical protein
VQQKMREIRQEKNNICTLRDVVAIIAQQPVCATNTIVAPRLALLLEMFGIQQISTEGGSPYCTLDVSQLSQKHYIALTITVLAYMFVGGKRMLVLKDFLPSSTAVTLLGFRFWHQLHYCIPAFNAHFRTCFSRCFSLAPSVHNASPHAYQYLTGDAMATVVWLGFAQYMTIVTAAVRKHILAQLVSKNLSIDALVNTSSLRKASHPVTVEESERFVRSLIVGFLMKEVPSPLHGVDIEKFGESARVIDVSPLALYICKSAIEFEMTMQRKEQEKNSKK